MQQLDYPFDEQVPEPAELTQVATGIYWLRMSLPMALDHINLYVLEDEEGWWIVDTGIKLGDTRECWETLFAGPLKGKPVIGVIATHMHPDHIGQAGWLCDHWKVPLYMSFGEYYNARAFSAMTGDDINWTTEQHYHRSGMGIAYVDNMRKHFMGFGTYAEKLPIAFNRLQQGDRLTIGGRDWEVMIGRGHSPEHVCLYDARDHIILSGDQILPKITSNISVSPAEPESNPLKEWLDSISYFESLPEDTLVLPAHNTPFKGVHVRLQFLREHHEDHLEALEEACLEPQVAIDLLPVMFERELDESQKNMALGECIAHLNYLMYDNRVQRFLDDEGLYRYQSTDPAVAARLGSQHHLDPPPQQV